MPSSPLRVAVIDMYDGTPNMGMQCIDIILSHWSKQNSRTLEIEIFHLRDHKQIPDLSFDIYISTGGPGSPSDSIHEEWDRKYTQWLEDVIAAKKWVFLICHSFQIACRHFNIGKVSLRKSRQIGILPVHPLINDSLFSGLTDPFFTLESRYYQITEPNDVILAQMGASIIALEKERPRIPLERAIMGVKFNEYMYGVQFHPEADGLILDPYFNEEGTKKSIIDEFGIEKWNQIIESIKDPQKIETTFSLFIPNFLNKVIQR
jgi:GMP synthase-like glutamine amidotransferase